MIYARPELDTAPFTMLRNRLRMPLPETDAELEVLTKLYFGKPLHLNELTCWGGGGRYEVKELYNSYHGNGAKYTSSSCDGYDHSAVFWNTAVGVLGTGGVAGRSYGSFACVSYRHERRIKKWISNRRNGTNYLRAPFARLARKYGAGENVAIRGSGVLTSGREDGALAVSDRA